MEAWKHSQQRRLSDILSGKFASIAGEPPHATRAFEAARRISKHARLADGICLSFYEGTPASQVADEVEAAADEVERIARVHKAPRPVAYRHDVVAASKALDEIATFGWFRDHHEDLGGGNGPRWGRYEGDPCDTPSAIHTRVVRCGPSDYGAWHRPAPITINPPIKAF